jgi:predicted Zn-ribbon and HTH transcriptional regulator
MPLIVKCKSCGFEHPSVTMTNHNEDCPQCGNISTYDKPDYSFKEVK